MKRGELSDSSPLFIGIIGTDRSNSAVSTWASRYPDSTSGYSANGAGAV